MKVRKIFDRKIFNTFVTACTKSTLECLDEWGACKRCKIWKFKFLKSPKTCYKVKYQMYILLINLLGAQLVKYLTWTDD